MPEELPAEARLAARSAFTLMNFGLFLTAVIWGTHYAIAKAAIDALTPFMYNGMRFPVAALALGIMLKASGSKLALPRREFARIVIVSVALYGLYQGLFMNGLNHTTVANSVLISTTAPALLVLLNIWLKRERGTRRIYSGLAAALGGVLLVVVSRFAGQITFGGSATLLGDALSVAAAVVWAGVTLAMRDTFARNPVMASSFWMLACGAVIAVILAVPDALHYDWSKFRPELILVVMYSATVAIGVGGTIWNIGLKRLGASRTAIYVNLQPIVAALSATIFLGEPFTVWLVLGTAMVLGGMWLLRLG